MDAQWDGAQVLRQGHLMPEKATGQYRETKVEKHIERYSKDNSGGHHTFTERSSVVHGAQTLDQ